MLSLCANGASLWVCNLYILDIAASGQLNASPPEVKPTANKENYIALPKERKKKLTEEIFWRQESVVFAKLRNLLKSFSKEQIDQVKSILDVKIATGKLKES